jgi:cytidylate kinase
MIITISGLPGSGKSTLAKYLAEKLGFEYYGIGRFRRDLAKKKGITLEELNKQALTDDSSNVEADEMLKELADKDKLVVDAWLGYHFLPHSIKLFVDADLDVRANRVFLAKREEEEYATQEKVKEKLQERIRLSQEHYKKLYNLDNIFDHSNFDIVLNTSKLTVTQTALEALSLIKRLKNETAVSN